jgi:hypothetical protein
VLEEDLNESVEAAIIPNGYSALCASVVVLKDTWKYIGVFMTQ